MLDESLYLTTHEAALAVVATAMKKARLLIDTLIINLFMGGLLFTSGGMLHVMVQSYCPETFENNPGFVYLLQGLVYPIGLFYVVIMGVDLFNSNVLFFTVGVARGAVLIVDLVISWLVSWWFNLVGNIFVCYIVCHYSAVASHPLYIAGSTKILEDKMKYTFVQTLIKAMAGNFFVCLAIYLQLMAKPLHVKFLMMLIPVFTFVCMGFTHSVADMYMIVIGLINGANVSVAKTAWKLFLPGCLGNIIGGGFFSLLVPWYLHLFVVERDQRILNLPHYDVRDEQPELNQDSRVVRVRRSEEAEEEHELYGVNNDKLESDNLNMSSLSSTNDQIHDLALVRALSSRSAGRSSRLPVNSPTNVFPVLGMGPPAERERSIASGRRDEDDVLGSQQSVRDGDDRASADFIGDQIKRSLTMQPSVKRDLEAQPRKSSVSTISFPRQLHRFSFSGRRNSHKNLEELNSRFTKAGITMKAANASDGAAGTSDFYQIERPQPMAFRASTGNLPKQAAETGPSTSSSSAIRLYDPAGRD